MTILNPAKELLQPDFKITALVVQDFDLHQH